LSTVYSLRVWTRFLASPEAVWALKTDPAQLTREFRPYGHLTMPEADISRMRAALDAGGSCSAEARLWPAGMRWPMHLTVLEPGRRYRDTSTNALYRVFEHTHILEPGADGTRYVDAVRFEPAIAPSAVVARMTRIMFEHRHRVAARSLPTDPAVVGISVLRVDTSAIG
jgi:ligand-binding SRPBCC domain-containing protein